MKCSSVLAVLCLSVFLVSPAFGADVIASLFADRSCTEVLTPPVGLELGECAYSAQFGFYFNISTTPTGQARYNFGCRPGCVGCTEVGTVPYGSCLVFKVGSSLVYASAWRVDKSALLSATIYADAQCTRELPYGTITVQSGSCTYTQLLRSSFTAALFDARDSPKNERVAYGLECNQQCGFCSTYGRTGADLCIPAFNVYLKVKSSVNSPLLAQ